MQKTLLTPRSQIDFFDFEWQPWVLMRSCWPCPQQIAGAEKNGAPGVLAPFRNAATIRVKGAFFLFVFCSAGGRATLSRVRGPHSHLRPGYPKGKRSKTKGCHCFSVEGREVRKDLPSHSLQLFFPARYHQISYL